MLDSALSVVSGKKARRVQRQSLRLFSGACRGRYDWNAVRSESTEADLTLLHRFRDVLASLPETGECGFEGLAAAACAQISGTTFRLVKSGRQFGRDFESVVDGAAILFEAKRYTSRLSYSDLATKLFEALDRAGRPVEVWGAAATVALDAMDAEDLRRAGEERGVTVLLLDWAAPLPRLACLLAGAREAVMEWFGHHAAEDRDLAGRALGHIRRHAIYAATLAGLRMELAHGTLGLAMARRRNADWMESRFRDRNAALIEFNQPLAPADPSQRPRPVARAALEARVRDAIDSWTGVAQAVVLTGMPDARGGAAPQGDEGVGKSWALARAWLTMLDDDERARPLLLFMGSHMWREGDEQRPLECLARLCMQQGGTSLATQIETERWILRLRRWLERPARPGARPVAIIVLDGINERAQRWAALITSLAVLARTWPLRIVVTSRRGSYERDLAPQLRAIEVQTVTVEGFSDQDLDAALRCEGRDPATVREPLRAFLRNPRILSVGIALLDRLDPDDFGIERLLYEYLVKRQEDRAGRSSLTAVQLAQTLVGHAREIRDRLLAQRTAAEAEAFDHAGALQRLMTPWTGLVDDLGDIVESQFLRTVGSRRNRYTFTTQARPLGMALLVVDELDQAVADGRAADLPALLDAIVDPIGAIDATSKVILAALELALADPDVAEPVAEELLVAVLALQNVPEDCRARIFAGLRERPATYTAATDRLFGQSRAVGRREWMTEALEARRFDEGVQPVLDEAIRRWLRSWQPSPIEPDLTGFPAEQAAGIEREHAQRVRDHELTLASLTSAERDYVERELLTRPEGRECGVDAVAVRLLAGRRLLPFASDLFAWCIATAVGWGSGAYDDMRWLRRLASLDWEETTRAIAELCDTVVSPSRSQAFGWAHDYALSFSGDPAQAARADALWPLLHDGPRRLVHHAGDGICDVDPLDCDADAPSRALDAVRQRYGEWCSRGERSPVLMRRADTAMTRARQVLCRFEPEWVADCHRAFARRASEITGVAPAVIASFISPDMAILEGPETAALMHWLRRLLADGPMADPNRDAPGLLLGAILPGLEPLQQFDAMTSMLDDERHPFWLERLAHPLPEDVLTAKLAEAAARGATSLRYGLIFAGANPVRPAALRAAMDEALSRGGSASRSIALRTMIRVGAVEDIDTFARGDWRWSETASLDRGAEDFFGSVCLVKALGARDDPTLLARIHPALWSRAVMNGGPAVAGAVGDAVIEALMSADASMRPPDGIEIACTRSDEGIGSIDELAGIDITVSYPMGSLIEEPEAAGRRPLGMADYIAFEQAIIASGRGPLLYPLASAAIDRIAAVSTEIFMRAVSAVETVPAGGDAFASAVVLAHDLARALSGTDAARAARLFSRFDGAAPIVAELMPFCRIPRQHRLLWLADDAPAIEEVRKGALDRAFSDDVLAAHALAASMAGKHGWMRNHVLEEAESRHPASMAKALTLAGFCSLDDAFDALFASPRFAHGFLGDVRANALRTHRKAAWAERWFRSALGATTALDVWRFSELAAASADGRCVLWMEEGVGSAWFEQTRPIFRNALSCAAVSAENDRKGKLFGERAPPDAIRLPAAS